MKPLPADFLEKSRFVFIDNPGITLLDVRKQVEAEPEGTARRDRLSALAAVPKLWKRPLATIPASGAGLVSLFRGLHGPELGVKRKRFQNIKSHITQGVRAYGAVAPSLTSRIPLTPKWGALLDIIRAANERQKRNYISGLTRFACFCSATGIEPEQAGTPHVLLGFHEALAVEAAVKDPKIALRLTITYWNMQAKRLLAWPAIRLRSPFPSKTYILPLEDFPIAFRADLADWAKAQAKRRKFGEAGPTKPKRPATIKFQTEMLRRFASLLIREDILAIEQIASLNVLVDPQIARQGLEVLWRNASEMPTGQLRNFAHILRIVGRYYVKLPAEQDAQLKACCDFLGPNPRGLSTRNVERLRQFDDMRNLVGFLDYPYTLIKELKQRVLRDPPLSLYRQAKVYERAAAAAILIYSRVRMRNLHTIKLDTNLLWRGDHIVLSYTEDETKNRNVLQLELPVEATRLVRTFIGEYRKHLLYSDCPYLFPGKKGGARPVSTMAQDFRKGLRRVAGLSVNPHLVRHIIGKIATEHDPALVTAVSQALGHADFQTTLDYYLPNQSLSSSRTINRLLESKVTEGLKRHGKRRPK